MVKHWQFFKSFVRSPKQMGSVIPSSRYLVRALLGDIDWQQSQTIVELGAGTGAVTASIAEKSSADTLFICFEFDEQLHQNLVKRFPQATMAYDAFKLTQTLALENQTQADYIISSLPFANFSKADQHLLLETIKAALAPGGAFIVYQYSKQLEILLEQHFSRRTRSYVWQNIPPAYVYHCSNPCED